MVPNFNLRWLAPWWSAESEKREALISARTLQFKRSGPATMSPEAVFIWVPKAAGTSVFDMLSHSVGMTKHNVVPDILQKSDDELAKLNAVTFGHLTTDSLIDLGVLDSRQLEAAFTFGFVRDPFKRVASLFSYLRRQRAIPNVWSMDRFLKAIEAEKPRAGLWNVVGLSQAAPMVDWMRPSKWKGPDLVLRFEDMEGSIKELSKYIDVPSSIPHLNSSRAKNAPIPLSKAGLDFIQDYYSDDFTEFDYRPRPPEGLFELRP